MYTDSICDIVRGTLADIDHLELSAAFLLASNPKAHRDRLLMERKVRSYIDEMAEKSRYLLNILEDKDGHLAKEIDSLKIDGDNFDGFYEKLVWIKNQHRQFPVPPAKPFDPATVTRNHSLELQELDANFSGEEGHGKYLDLHEVFSMYLNLDNIEKMPYESYLSHVDHFTAVPADTKKTPEYLEYLETLRIYLESFFKRAKPLFDFESLRRKEVLSFEESWALGQVRGWERTAADMDPDDDTVTATDDLYCIACDRTYAKPTVFEAHKKGKKHIKAVEALVNNGVDVGDTRSVVRSRWERRQADWGKMKPVAFAETLIVRYMQNLSDEREDTRVHVERKQALTEKERLEDPEEEIMIIADDDDDDADGQQDRIYNPLKLPLGWDGKPIPFWLYKLHGLSIELTCEICGNHVYRGRREFERHFQDWRHTQGMRSLGLSNSKHFQDITSIEDAYALAERLKHMQKQESVAPEAIEEYEDTQGNVYNKKTYEDLKRQGLL